MQEDFVEHIVARDKGPLAVVMNGPVTEEYGEEIDNSPTVYRFNKFTTLGYEKYVGSRTDRWIVNGDGSVAAHPELKALCPFPEWRYPKKTVEDFKAIQDIIYCKYDIRGKAPAEVMHPTTGLVFLLLLTNWNKRRIRVYGFNGLKQGHYFNKRHRHSIKHEGGLEFEFIKTHYASKIEIR